MDGQDDAMKSAMELFAARLAKRDVERPITDHRTVERLIAMLEPHEQQVVRLRIGLGPSPALTLAATAKIVGVSPSRIGQIEDKAFRRIRWVCNNIDIHDRSALDALIARRRDEAAEAERIRKRDALQKALDQERKRKAKQDRDEVRRAKARDSAWNHKLRVAQAELDRMKSDAQFFAEQIAQIEQRANWLRAILPRDRQLAALREQANEIRDAIASAEASISNMLASPPDGPQLGKEASTNDGH